MSSRLLRLCAMQLPCIVIVSRFIICCSTAVAQDQDQLQEIWQRKVPEETKRFYDFLNSRKTKSYTFSTVNKLLENGKLRSFNTRCVVKRKDPFWLLSDGGDADNPMDTIKKRCCGLNSKYAFMLKVSKNGKDWVIHNITEVTPDLDEETLFNMRIASPQGKGFRAVVNNRFDLFDRDNVFALLFSGTSVVKTSENSTVEFADRSSAVAPWKIVEIPGFQLRSISADGANQNIIRVDFDYETADAEQKKIGIVNCQMDFDIEAKCYPVKSHHALKSREEETILDWSRHLTQTKENEYEQKSLVQLKKKSNSVVTLLEETKEETVFSLDDPPESDFTLSAFGLPEPPGIEWKKPFPWYLVFAGIGTACLGGFLYLRSRAKRARGRVS